MTRLTVFDGATSIGGSKIFLEEKGEGVFLDFGTNFAKQGRFFQDFLRHRSIRGIHDLIQLNLIPKVDIYRKDLVPSDIDVTHYPKLNVKAVLVSHAHLDHCGGVGYLREDIPVVASNTTTAILKAFGDTSGRMDDEMAYVHRRHKHCLPPKRVDSISVVMKLKSKGQLNKASLARELKDPLEGMLLTGTGARKGRCFYSFDDCPEEMANFMSERPGDKQKPESAKLNNIKDLTLPFEVEAYPVAHSIFGSVAYIVKADSAIAYTGDFRMNGRNSDGTKRFLEQAKNAAVLIIEGTRLGRADRVNVTEDQVSKNCLAVVRESKKLVIADFAPRNFERLEAFMEIAEKTDRHIVLTPKDAYFLYSVGCAGSKCVVDNGPVSIYLECKIRDKSWEGVVKGRWKEKYVNPIEISENPEKYLMCFSLYDLKHLLDIKPKGGDYIYSSSEAFSEEQEFEFARLANWLDYFNLRIHGFKMVGKGEDKRPEFVKGFHASGHISQRELVQVIDDLDPDLIVPVHTEQPEWFKENFEDVRFPHEGKTYPL